MPIKKITKVKEDKVVVESPIVPVVTNQEVKIKPLALTQEFSNGDVNTLRDKINEIIKYL